MLIYKRQDYRDNKEISVCQWCMWRKRGDMNRQSTKDFYGSENTLYVLSWWIYVIILSSKPITCTPPTVNTKVNSGL